MSKLQLIRYEIEMTYAVAEFPVVAIAVWIYRRCLTSEADRGFQDFTKVVSTLINRLPVR